VITSVEWLGAGTQFRFAILRKEKPETISVAFSAADILFKSYSGHRGHPLVQLLVVLACEEAISSGCLNPFLAMSLVATNSKLSLSFSVFVPRISLVLLRHLQHPRIQMNVEVSNVWSQRPPFVVLDQKRRRGSQKSSESELKTEKPTRLIHTPPIGGEFMPWLLS
jgi:hypothetical protein